MNATDLQTRPHEARPVASIDVNPRPRSSLLVLAGVTVANVGAVLTVAAGISQPVVMAVGLALFVAGSATAMRFAGPVPRRSAGRITSPQDVGPGTQLGADPEQVIGRQTGARV